MAGCSLYITPNIFSERCYDEKSYVCSFEVLLYESFINSSVYHRDYSCYTKEIKHNSLQNLVERW